MNMTDTAKAFFEACETGKGWDGGAAYCTTDASFSCQSGALADALTLEAYAEWMKGLLTPIPDGRYELKGFAADDDRSIVLAFAVFHGTQTGEGALWRQPAMSLHLTMSTQWSLRAAKSVI